MNLRKLIILLIIVGLLAGLVLLMRVVFTKEVDLTGEAGKLMKQEEVEKEEVYISPFRDKPEFPVKAVYSTFYTASSDKGLQRMIALANETEINAIVIDIKDYSGKVGYDSVGTLADAIGADSEVYIKDLNALVRRLHENNIYAIARITVFQDPFLAEARPEWAIKTSDGRVWKDNKGLSWLDPAARPVWDYNLELAKEAIKLGFDEINFDYVRFPSDGDLDSAVYPFWNEETLKSEIMRRFFEYVYGELAPLGIKTSVDIFGQTFYDGNDLGVGQLMEIVVPYFDYVSPMVYPSHYIKGFLGFQNPAVQPYEVVKTTLEVGQSRLSILKQALADVNATDAPDYIFNIRNSDNNGSMAKVRPWLQDFDLGADYNSKEIADQIRAALETGSFGWMLWSPSNVYTEGGLEKE